MKKLSLILFLLISLSVGTLFAESAELRATTVIKGDALSLDVTVKAVNAPDLAGIKLVLQYDVKRMQYKSLTKSKETQSMMHVVNDKNPGTLIIVMASATGQKNPDFDLFALGFELLESSDKPAPLEIKVSSVEMMSAALTEIPCPTLTFHLK